MSKRRCFLEITSSSSDDEAPSKKKKKRGFLASSSDEDVEAPAAPPPTAAPASAAARGSFAAPVDLVSDDETTGACETTGASSSSAAAGEGRPASARRDGVVFMGFSASLDRKNELKALGATAKLPWRDTGTSVSGKTGLLVMARVIGTAGGHSTFSRLKMAVELDVPLVDEATFRAVAAGDEAAPSRGDAARRKRRARALLARAADDKAEAPLYDGVYALFACRDDEAEALRWLDDTMGGLDFDRARVSADIDGESIRARLASRPFVPRPWDFAEGDRRSIVVLAEFPDICNVVTTGPPGHMTVLYLEDWQDGRYGNIGQRITASNLEKVESLVRACDPTYKIEGPNQSTRPVAATFQFDSTLGRVASDGPIAKLREAIQHATGLPYRSTGGTDKTEGHVTAGLLAPQGIHHLPLRLRVTSCPAVRCKENQDLFRFVWLGLPETVMGVAAPVADATFPVTADSDFTQIKGIGKWRSRYLRAFFDTSIRDAPAAPAFSGAGRTLQGTAAPTTAPMSKDDLRAARLAHFG